MKRIVSGLMTLCIMILLITTTIVSSSAEVTKVYEQEFIKFCLGEDYNNYTYEITYKEYYRYFNEDNNTDVPDWIFGEGYMPDLSPAYAKGVFGDYCIYQSAHFSPFILGCFVYVPSENKFYDIVDAWSLGFENLEVAFAECTQNKIPGIYLIGDADADGVLSVMDATYIQLAQASLCDYRGEDSMIYALHYCGRNLRYISDINGDGERNILDATAIQLKLAGLE
ncbi:MAG: hypothetical protein IJ275_01775 [Ruminococcus sp.]|nr:hypothetical protein [Ruminococcus sp.]